MSDLPPATLLRQAATRIRQLAAGTQPGPWTYNEDLDHIHNARGAFVTTAGACHWADARWIATFSPAIAEPLAAWLDEVATLIEIQTERGDPIHVELYRKPLEVARTLLAQSTPTEETP